MMMVTNHHALIVLCNQRIKAETLKSETERKTHTYRVSMSSKEYDVGNGYTYKHSVIRTGSGRDVWMVKSVTQNVVNTIEKTYVPRNDDVFLCTFIKSGTTWVQAILRELIDIAEGTDTRVEGVSVGLTEGERIPWIEEMAAIAGPTTIYTKRLNEQSPKRRRVFKTHLPYPVVQNWATKGTKFIFVVRDPRDVAVSAWHTREPRILRTKVLSNISRTRCF